ncbi:type II secretion system protein [Clostridium grantii]|uniref:Prepilin-type N-terminal cleavage/methylation domain-containing protein n=1 Tax=Clostridium grantii DSM 8605 TaxID=1121316 RepID=A0A1M5RHU1_9CLOT|nr:type II secretion system protein [Clostridium grantii]SHH25885.1 hypothetical protein SAMN02745207_00543 [Clostridium grantii DSM 8605]
MIKSRKKAITLIELIIVIGILGVVMGTTSTFFLSNYKSLNNVEDKADLQHAAQSVINAFSNATLNSTSYSGDSSSIFKFDKNSFKLENNEFKEGTRIIASNIKSIVVSVPEGSDEDDGIKVTVIAGMGDITETIETSLYFRMGISFSGVSGSIDDTQQESQENSSLPENLVFYSTAMSFNGKQIDAGSNSIVINGDLYSTSIISGGTEVKASKIYVKGNLELNNNKKFYGTVYTENNLSISGGKYLFGETYVKGNLIINNNGYLDGDLHLGGSATINYSNSTITNNRLQNVSGIVDKNYQFNFPDYKIELKDESWYVSNGYTINNSSSINISYGDKIYSKVDCSFTYNKDISDSIIIVSEGNITLGTNGNSDKEFKGVLIAKKNIKFTKKKFEGVIISGGTFSTIDGDTTLKLNNISNYFDANNKIPVN